MKDFDLVRAAFYLVAGVIAAQVLGAFVMMAFCIWDWREIATVQINAEACTSGKMSELLAAALAAALAFAGGRLRGNKDDHQ